MRILHIIDSGGMYGAEVMLLNLIEEQIRQGLKPIIGSIGNYACGEKAIEIEARKLNFHIEIFRMHPGPNFIGAFKIIKYAKSTKCDLIHSHGYKGNILLGFVPKKFRKLPLITTIHGWTTSGTTLSRMRLYEWLDLLALPLIDAVVLVNEQMLTHPKLAERKNINLCVVNNGIHIHKPKPYPCRRLNFFPDSKLKIVAVGRLSIEKGFDILLKAMAQVVEKENDISLVIFGEGGERRKLEKLVQQLGLQRRVKMPGFIENASKVFFCFDLLVMPSLTEGLPITILEAMRAKLPLIASNVGGIPKVLEYGSGGLLVQSGSVDDLVRAIIQFVNSKSLCQNLADKAIIIFERNYTATHMAKNYRQVYSNLLVERGLH